MKQNMKCAIHQPQFLPWLGYLHKINSADVFVFLDNVQFKKNEFQNRNKIRLQDSAHWITVPVSFKFGDTLRDAQIAADPHWQRKMSTTLQHGYGKSPHYGRYASELVELISRKWDNLADLNIATVEWLMKCFKIRAKILVASTMPEFSSEPTQRLIEICRHIHADTYLSGAGGREYLDVSAFEKAGIQLEFQDFLHPVYPQCYDDPNVGFVSHLSAVDALFNCGGGPAGKKAITL